MTGKVTEKSRTFNFDLQSAPWTELWLEVLQTITLMYSLNGCRSVLLPLLRCSLFWAWNCLSASTGGVGHCCICTATLCTRGSSGSSRTRPPSSRLVQEHCTLMVLLLWTTSYQKLLLSITPTEKATALILYTFDRAYAFLCMYCKSDEMYDHFEWERLNTFETLHVTTLKF